MQYKNHGREGVSGIYPSFPEQIQTDQSKLPPSILRWIGEAADAVIIVWDEDGNAQYISRAFEQSLGYKLSEIQALKWHDLVSRQDACYIKKTIDKSGGHDQVFTSSLLHKNGQYIRCQCKLRKITDQMTGSIFYASIIKDMTERKELEEMIIRYEKMSDAGQLAAGIAHEIRNPLTSLKGFLQLLQAKVKGRDEYYKIMLEEIEKMEKITTELLFVSKPLTENMKMEPVTEMIEDVVTLLSTQARIKGIDIEYAGEDGAFVYCDRSQVKQVLLNLIKNAVEAMEEPGTIQVKAKKSEEDVCIQIIDEGAGIPEELIQKLGEPFFTTKKSGTGLGLMITKKILERHNGKLSIKRNREKGSTFGIYFPIQ
ncbi:ATP-binding protein [Virgibacillus sediminis]|uniref:histidine kinase n=1 Tax=Virgibacillus sediminis TaxID=202260 RepID=A0ABV7A1U0_9BACI